MMSFGAVGLNNVYNYKHLDVTTTSSISSIIPVYSQNLWNGRTNLLICLTVDWFADRLTDWLTLYFATDLSPLRIRLGGSLQDNVVYDVGTPQVPCRPFVYNTSVMFNFQGGCLSMQRWTELTTLFHETGYILPQLPTVWTIPCFGATSVQSPLASPNFSSQRPLKAAEHCLESKHAKTKWLLMKS